MIGFDNVSLETSSIMSRVMIGIDGLSSVFDGLSSVFDVMLYESLCNKPLFFFTLYYVLLRQCQRLISGTKAMKRAFEKFGVDMFSIMPYVSLHQVNN